MNKRVRKVRRVIIVTPAGEAQIVPAKRQRAQQQQRSNNPAVVLRRILQFLNSGPVPRHKPISEPDDTKTIDVEAKWVN